MILNNDAIQITIHVGILITENGTKTPAFPNPIPVEIMDCLYKVQANYEYIDNTCYVTLTVRNECLKNLKEYLDKFSIEYGEEKPFYEFEPEVLI